MTGRRGFLIAGSAGMWMLARCPASFAQSQGKTWRIGVLSYRTRPASSPSLQALSELGYIEGKNLVVEWRSAEGNTERLPGLAAELVNLKVDVILSGNTPSHRAAQKATAVIPIVMSGGADPVAQGLVSSLAHPGGNITGVTNISSELAVKHLEMLLRMVPKLTRVAVLLNPANSGNMEQLKSVQTAARNTNASIVPVESRTAVGLEAAFSAMVREKSGALVVANDSNLNLHLPEIAELAAKYRLPSISPQQVFVQSGGLMSFGPNSAEQSRRAAVYVDKIFKGAKPGDLPIELPTKFEFIINGRIAKALGLVIPKELLVSADKVIE